MNREPADRQGLTQKGAARLIGVSASYLRASGCPKHVLPGNGPRGRPMVRYLRDEVLAWARGDKLGTDKPFTGQLG